MAYCSLCKRTLNLEIPVTIVDEKKYFPFEYIFIHGKPEHAIMLFLDANLSVRDEAVYTDLLTAKKQAKEFSSLIHMTEYEALGSIYNEPMRTEILKTLSEGPMKSDELIEALKKFPEFDQKNFQLIVLPLIKTNLVKSRWLHETFFECYFLVKDFIIFKALHKQTFDLISNNPKYSSIKDSYLTKVKELLQGFKEKIISSQDQTILTVRQCLQILTSKEYKEIMSLLGNGPISMNEVGSSLDTDMLAESFISDIFYIFNINGEKYCSLLYDLEMQYFLPRYLMNEIASKLKEKKISNEMAFAHLDLLFESEKELKIMKK
ncbi:MAG: hypothetical protein ACXAAI_00515 [Promethearchaeota archaeon]|jgi:hypothetical protein